MARSAVQDNYRSWFDGRRCEDGLDEVDDGGAVPAEDLIDEQVGAEKLRRGYAEAAGEVERWSRRSPPLTRSSTWSR